MEKALLEEHVRYGEARFRDKELVRLFVNRIHQDIAELEAINLTRREWYQKGFNEAMKQRTCEGCKHKPNDGECYYEPCGTCARFFYDHYEPVYEYQFAYKKSGSTKTSNYLTDEEAKNFNWSKFQRLDFTKRERKCEKDKRWVEK